MEPYEEKYKEALERASKLRVQNPFDTVSQMMEHVFPELKESESEIIRKMCIEYLGRGYQNCSFADDIKNIEKCIAWLEKQGEQPQGKSAHEAVRESKFKAGDWIISLENECVYQVIEVKRGIYVIRNIYNKEFKIGIEACERTGRLWTIQDARDGEVLADKDNNIGIFQECEDTDWNSYIYLGCDGKLRGFSIGGCHEQIDTHPATQEQRDTLYKAMAVAGYIFDFGKKELKKIENEIEIPFGAKDSELQEATYYIPKGFHAEIDNDKVVIKKGEKPTAWSEKDEAKFEELFCTIESNGNWVRSIDAVKQLSSWLKSLKDRYTWKPSDEQIEAFEHFVRSIGENGYASPHDTNTKLLYSLLEQLKKLKY